MKSWKSLSYSAVVVSAVFAMSAHASQKNYDERYFTLDQVQIQEVQPDETLAGPVIIITLPAPKAPGNTPSGIPAVDQAEVVLDKIINMGKKIWAIVEANKPVVNVATDYANALPFGVNGWENLATWREPVVREYRASFRNLYGTNVVDFTFRVMFTPGGSVGGHGLYLANATVLPAHLAVAWGYKFNAQMSIAGVMNAGSTADPVAAMQLQLHWSVDTVMKHEQRTENFYVKGDGTYKVMGSSGGASISRRP